MIAIYGHIGWERTHIVVTVGICRPCQKTPKRTTIFEEKQHCKPYVIYAKMNERFIAVCYLDERDLGATIIANELALDCPRYSGGQFAEY